MEDFNKNEKQHNFNQIRGSIAEWNDGEKFGSVTLKVGHENPRMVNLVIKKALFDEYRASYNLDDKVLVKFYLSSRNKNPEGLPKWSTMANVLTVERI